MVKTQLLYKNGDYYEGNIQNGALQGRGTYKFKNGSYYEGQFKQNLFHGKGKLHDAFNEIVTIGTFQNGFSHGQVRVTYSDGSLFQGTSSKGLRHGKGNYKYSKEAQQRQYIGDFKDDSYQGSGQLKFKDGSVYIGEFKQNNYHGEGQFKAKDYVHIGQYRVGQMEGKGIIKYTSNNEKYDGYFSNNMKEGLGTYYYQDGTIYQGAWKKNLRHGKGKLLFKNGDSFEGQFEDDHYIGEGIFKFGKWQLIGQFYQSQLNGPMKLRTENIEIEGLYKQGIKNGIFLMQKTLKKGQKISYRGQFKQGKENIYTVSFSHRI